MQKSLTTQKLKKYSKSSLFYEAFIFLYEITELTNMSLSVNTLIQNVTLLIVWHIHLYIYSLGVGLDDL